MNTIKRAVALILSMSAAAELFAAPAGTRNQRLEWEAAQNVTQYEVIIEKREENQWRQAARQTVQNKLYVDCELSAGDYRFCVRSFDVIGRPGKTSEWAEFSIIEKMETLPETENVTAVVDTDALAAALAALSVPAASADFSKSMWRIQAALAPLVVLPIGTFNEFYEDAVFQPAGFAIALEAFPIKREPFAFGIQLLPSWNFLSAEKFGNARSTHITGLNAALAVQIKIFRSSAVNIHAGGGMSFYFSHGNFDSGEVTGKKDAVNPSLLAGISLRTFFSNAVFIDAGVDYFHYFASDNTMTGYVRPLLGIGWWF